MNFYRSKTFYHIFSLPIGKSLLWNIMQSYKLPLQADQAWTSLIEYSTTRFRKAYLKIINEENKAENFKVMLLMKEAVNPFWIHIILWFTNTCFASQIKW